MKINPNHEHYSIKLCDVVLIYCGAPGPSVFIDNDTVILFPEQRQRSQQCVYHIRPSVPLRVLFGACRHAQETSAQRAMLCFKTHG